MFRLTPVVPASPFILDARQGHVAPGIAAFRVAFAPDQWNDNLFTQLAIPFPASLAGAARKRKAEHLAGRYCATQLLRAAGCHLSVEMMADRAPGWPAGFRGAISHSNGQAIALLTTAASGFWPGVDIEEARPNVMLETADMYVTADEQALLDSVPLLRHQALLIVFSAKESLFKSLYPRVQHFFDFDAALLRILDTRERTFTLELTRPLSATLPAGQAFQGHWRLTDTGVITALW